MGSSHSTSYVSVSVVMTSTTTITQSVDLIRTRIPMPIAGQRPLSANVLGQHSDRTTLAVYDCAPPSGACVLSQPLTVTAGPGTFHFDGSGSHWEVLGQLDCQMWGVPQTAACTWTVGEYPSSEMLGLASSWVTTPAPSSATVTANFTDGGFYPTGGFASVNVTLASLLPIETGAVYNSVASLAESDVAWTVGVAGVSTLLVMCL